MVLIVICKSGSTFRSTPYNLWLASLATADLLLSIIAIPSYILSTSVYNHPRGKEGDSLCRFLTAYPTMFLLAEASVYHLVGISIERFKVVMNPIRERARVSKRNTKIKIVLAWILAFLVIFPPVFRDTTYSRHHPTIGNYCTFRGSNLVFAWIRNVGVFVANYIVPLAVLLYTSVCIGQHLKRLEQSFNNSSIGPNKHEGRSLAVPKKRTLKILVMVVAAFITCWTPNRVMFFSFQFDSSLWNRCYFQIGVLLGFSNSFLNCVLYAFVSDEFSRHFSLTFPNVAKLWDRLSLTCKCKKNVSGEPLIESNAQTKSVTTYGTILTTA